MKKSILLAVLFVMVLASVAAILQSGWTSTTNSATARTALGAAGLTNNNVFTGSNQFTTVYSGSLTNTNNIQSATINTTGNAKIAGGFAVGTSTAGAAGTITSSGNLTSAGLVTTLGAASDSSYINLHGASSKEAYFQWNVGGFELYVAGAPSVKLLNGTVGVTVLPNLVSVNTNFSAASLTATNASNIRTNIAQFDTINTNWIVGTRYTNATSMGFAARRAKVSYSISLTAAAAGTAQMSLYVENPGVITNRTVVSAGPLAGLIVVEMLTDEVGPNEVFYFTDETSGVGGSAAGFAGSGHWKGK